MDSNRMDDTTISKKSTELMNKELAKMNKLQANMMKEAKKLLDSAELRQIEQSYKQYENQIRAIQNIESIDLLVSMIEKYSPDSDTAGITVATIMAQNFRL